MEAQKIEDYKTLQEWADDMADKGGKVLNMGTLRKRRQVSGIGRLIPPRTFIMTKEEFDRVRETPLPFCNKVVE
jgi:hypothetical protein